MDPSEIVRLAVRHRAEVLATLVALVGDLDTAEDLLQDTMVEIMRSPDGYDPERPFVPWARGVARNLVHRHWRRIGKQSKSELCDLETLADTLEEEVDEPATDEGEVRRLRACLERLPERSRRLLLLRYSENLLGPDLAKQAAMPVGSLRTTLARVRAALRRCLDGQTAAEA